MNTNIAWKVGDFSDNNYPVFFLPTVIGAFSPLLGWGLGILLLIVFSPIIRNRTRRLLGVQVILFGALIYASRNTNGSFNDDFSNNYYPYFTNIYDRGLIDFITIEMSPGISSSIEIGLLVIFRLISFLFGRLDINQLIFVITFVTGALFQIWLERQGLKNLPLARKALVLGLSLAMFSFGLCGQLTRQMLSCVALLIAISCDRRWWMWAWIAIAISFHLSSMVILPVLFAARIKKWSYTLVLIIVMLLVGFSLIYIMRAGLTEYLVNSGIDKLSFYASANPDNAIGFDFPYVFPMILLTVGMFISKRDDDLLWKHAMVIYCLMFFVLLPIPLASFRFSLLVLGTLLGYLGARVLDRFPMLTSQLLGIAIISYRFYQKVENAGDLGVALWSHYTMYSLTPFYYLYRLLT